MTSSADAFESSAEEAPTTTTTTGVSSSSAGAVVASVFILSRRRGDGGVVAELCGGVYNYARVGRTSPHASVGGGSREEEPPPRTPLPTYEVTWQATPERRARRPRCGFGSGFGGGGGAARAARVGRVRCAASALTALHARSPPDDDGGGDVRVVVAPSEWCLSGIVRAAEAESRKESGSSVSSSRALGGSITIATTSPSSISSSSTRERGSTDRATDETGVEGAFSVSSLGAVARPKLLPRPRPTRAAAPPRVSSIAIVGGLGALASAVTTSLLQGGGGGGVRVVELYSRAGRPSSDDEPGHLANARSRRRGGWRCVFTAQSFDGGSRESVDARFGLNNDRCNGSGSGVARPVPGIVLRANGALRDALVPRQTAGTVRSIFASKASIGSVFLSTMHPLTADVLFSSVSALLGSPGQANYAAANAALDAAAAAAREEGRAVRSAQFGAWNTRDAGMAATAKRSNTSRYAAASSSTLARLERLGVGALEPEVGVAALWSILGEGGDDAPPATTAVTPFEWATFFGAHPSLAKEHLFSEYTGVIRHVSSSARGEESGIVGDDYISSCEDAKATRVADVGAAVAAAVAAVLGAAVDENEPLMAAGLDSLGVTELRAALRKDVGVEIPATALFDHPSVAALASFIGGEVVTRAMKASPSKPSKPGKPVLSTSSALAVDPSRRRLTPTTTIVGHACDTVRGGSTSASGDGRLKLSSEADVVPCARWDAEIGENGGGGGGGGATSSSSPLPMRFGAFLLRRVDRFDPDAFGAHRGEAKHVDPQQRLLLESTLAALLGAGDGDFVSVVGNPGGVAVAVGIQHMEYAHLGSGGGGGGGGGDRTGGDASPYAATGSALSVAAGRIAFAFGFGSTAVAVDTACSAALTAVHVARSGALHRGGFADDSSRLSNLNLNSYSNSERSASSASSSRHSVCGGANLMLGATNAAAIRAAGMLAVDGRCKTFDAGADGYGRGEACGVFLLRHSGPGGESDSDQKVPIGVLGVRVDASAANQDGRSGSLTAPNGLAQRAAIAEAWRESAPASFPRAVSTHGTGTALGDPIEMSALRAACGEIAATCTDSMERTADMEPLPATAAAASKSSVGHAEAAAGTTAILEVVTTLRARTIAPLKHLRTLNAHLSAALESHRVCTGNGDSGCIFIMPRGGGGAAACGAAGVSAFAFMGTNVHVVLSGDDDWSTSAPSSAPSREKTTLPWRRERSWRLDGPDGGVLALARVAATRVSRLAARMASSPAEVRSIHWFPYDRVRVVNADP